MNWKHSGLVTITTRRIEKRRLSIAVILSAVMFVIACGSGSDDGPLPTFASPPTITPVVAQVQDTRDVSPVLTPTVEPPGQIGSPTIAPATASDASRPSPASGSGSDVMPGTVAPTPVFMISPVAARFVPDNIKLELGEETQAVRVEVTGIDSRSNGFQLHLLHPTSVIVESMSCLGPFEGGFVLGPAPLDDGTLVGCALLSSVDQTTGEVMELILKRTAPGLVEVAIRESDDIGDAFFSEFVWSDDESGEQGIVGVEPLTVRD
jgi:hypothetical protein